MKSFSCCWAARQSNVSLSVTISGIKNSIVDSVLLLCKEYKIVDTNKYRENAEAKFEKLYAEAKSMYAEDDVVSIVQYIQNGMPGCFEGICKELDCLTTQQQLKDFIDNYEINVKEDIDENYYWDKLLSKYGEGGKEISAEDFNSIFTMTYEETDPQSSCSSYFSTTKKTKEFRNDLITGYTLKPILVRMNANAYTNTYSIDVDYTLVNNNYKDADDVAKLTAHSSALKDKSFYENENISIFDLNANESERENTNYVLPITKEYEEDQINKTYFNNQDFRFTWSTSEEYGYDDFWTESNEKGEYKSKLDVSGLATSGMMINGVLLSDILNQAGKISLSGGSVSLSGKAKTKGEDSKQWKLTINGEVVDKDAIEWKLISTTTEKELPDSIKINDGVVSWTDQIESGTYNFYVLAIYKETKIQSPLITLTISSSEQLENVENFNHNLKDALYDEDTIDQKLIDFVNNVNFSLDYTENDYDTEREDHKKGVISVDDFTIGYKNSKNTFKASNLATKEAISKAINNDSGMTKRFSNNLYENMKATYDYVSNLVDKTDLINKSNDVKTEFGKLLNLTIINTSILSAITLFFIIALIIMYCHTVNRTGPFIRTKVFIMMLIVEIISLVTSIILLGITVNSYLDEFYRLEKCIKMIDNRTEDSSYTIIKSIKKDNDIFSNKKKFEELSIAEIKVKKYYYEKGYYDEVIDKDGKKTSDWIEYNGGVNNFKELTEAAEICCNVQKRFQLVWILDFIVLVQLPFIISLFIVFFAVHKPHMEAIIRGMDGREPNIMIYARRNMNNFAKKHSVISGLARLFLLLQQIIDPTNINVRNIV